MRERTEKLFRFNFGVIDNQRRERLGKVQQQMLDALVSHGLRKCLQSLVEQSRRLFRAVHFDHTMKHLLQEHKRKQFARAHVLARLIHAKSEVMHSRKIGSLMQDEIAAELKRVTRFATQMKF